MKGNYNDERKDLLEHFLAINVNIKGVDTEDVAIINDGLANLHSDIANELPSGVVRMK